MNKKAVDSLVRDGALIVLSIIVAVLLVYSNTLDRLLASAQGLGYLGSFIAGMFFTTVFTTAPAIAALGEIATVNSPVTTALLGAAGAVVGDMLIFRFVRDRLSDHISLLVSHRTNKKRRRALFKHRMFRYLTFFIGGLIIASPLPDELGVALLGFSKLQPSWFVPLSFVFNFIGIIGIGYVARMV